MNGDSENNGFGIDIADFYFSFISEEDGVAWHARVQFERQKFNMSCTVCDNDKAKYIQMCV